MSEDIFPIRSAIYFERTDKEGATWVCFYEEYDSNGYVVSEESALVLRCPYIDKMLENPEDHALVANYVEDSLDHTGELILALHAVDLLLIEDEEWEQEQKNVECTTAFYSAAMNVDLNKGRMWNV